MDGRLDLLSGITAVGDKDVDAILQAAEDEALLHVRTAALSKAAPYNFELPDMESAPPGGGDDMHLSGDMASRLAALKARGGGARTGNHRRPASSNTTSHPQGPGISNPGPSAREGDSSGDRPEGASCDSSGGKPGGASPPTQAVAAEALDPGDVDLLGAEMASRLFRLKSWKMPHERSASGEGHPASSSMGEVNLGDTSGQLKQGGISSQVNPGNTSSQVGGEGGNNNREVASVWGAGTGANMAAVTTGEGTPTAARKDGLAGPAGPFSPMDTRVEAAVAASRAAAAAKATAAAALEGCSRGSLTAQKGAQGGLLERGVAQMRVSNPGGSGMEEDCRMEDVKEEDVEMLVAQVRDHLRLARPKAEGDDDDELGSDCEMSEEALEREAERVMQWAKDVSRLGQEDDG